jgi:hypothetical protein
MSIFVMFSFLSVISLLVKDECMKIKNSFTYFNNVSSVVDLIRQHCSTGARMEISSWNGRPKPRP